MKKDQNPFELTDDEAKVFDSPRMPAEVRAFVARRRDSIGTETMALRKVTARAMAEVEAIRATRALAVEHGDLANLAEAKERIDTLERRAQALEVTASQKDAEIRRLTAAPAAAIHSGND